MDSWHRTLFRMVNKATPAVYRASKGRLANKAAGGSPVLLLTVAGRRTGELHTVPVAYFRHAGSYVVIGSAGGDAAEPQWFRNLRAADQATVEVGTEKHEVAVAVVDGPERDAIFTDVVSQAPSFADYETKSGRPMPVATLTPVSTR